GFGDLCVSLRSGLGPTQAHDSGVFGAAQSAHQGSVYAGAPLVHLGRSGAQALATWQCQDGLDLSQVAGVPGSIARLQSPHQAVSGRCPRPAGGPEDSQDQGTLARTPPPARTADCNNDPV